MDDIFRSIFLNEIYYILIQISLSEFVPKGTFTYARNGHWRRRAENWLQHKSLHAFTHTRSWSGGGARAKSVPQQMGPTPNFPRPLRNRMPQTIFVLKKWQTHLRRFRVCVNIPAVAQRECQNPPVSAQRICERSLRFQLTIIQHWLSQWLNAKGAASHCLNQWWPILQVHHQAPMG